MSDERPTELQATLWACQQSTDIRAFIPCRSEDELAALVLSIDVSGMPFSVFTGEGAVDARFNITCLFTGFLIADNRAHLAAPLLRKIASKLAAKTARGPARGSEFDNSQRLSAATVEIVRDVAKVLLDKDMNEDAALFLDANLTDYPFFQADLFWLFAAYQNSFARTRDRQSLAKACRAAKSFMDVVHRDGPNVDEQKVGFVERFLRERAPG